MRRGHIMRNRTAIVTALCLISVSLSHASGEKKEKRRSLLRTFSLLKLKGNSASKTVPPSATATRSRSATSVQPADCLPNSPEVAGGVAVNPQQYDTLRLTQEVRYRASSLKRSDEALVYLEQQKELAKQQKERDQKALDEAALLLAIRTFEKETGNSHERPT